jgi:hypothetical protein
MKVISSEKREGDPNGWCTVLVTALGSWGKAVPAAIANSYTPALGSATAAAAAC